MQDVKPNRRVAVVNEPVKEIEINTSPENEPVIAKRRGRPPKASKALVIDTDEPRKESKKRGRKPSLIINLKNTTNN